MIDKTEVKVEIACLCGQVKEIVGLRSKIPIETTVCHCNSCRYSKGTLYYSALPLSAPPALVPSLCRYDFSNDIERYFCNTCGTHVCYHIISEGSWHVSVGVVDRIVENEQVFCGLERIVKHQFVEDTLDGGLAIFLTGTPAEDADNFLQGPRTAAPAVITKSDMQRPDSLQASCHCGGVQLFITRPDAASARLSSPWPDLLRPYHSHDPTKPADEKWWIRGQKFLAGTCACRSCRLSNATPITCWAFVPKCNVFAPDGSAWEFGRSPLRSYESSQGTYREFCATCGASAFWHNEVRPDLLDISVGIFRAREGSRAHSWLEWCTDRVSFAEEAFDVTFVTRFATQLKLMKQN